ncbi:MAG TPA: hypothetical protein DCR70_07185 [Phycisphaerales bacterium]|nr:hypothetical protein [Phycisphaerales bacterium]
MRTRLHQLLVTCMALWMPFCCCQARAIADVAISAARTSATEASEANAAKQHHCCHAQPNDVPPGASPDAHSSHDPVTTDDGCCIPCKERALTTVTIDIEQDTIGAIDFVGTAILAVALNACQITDTTPTVSNDTGPPRAPSGRQALALHSTLLI